VSGVLVGDVLRELGGEVVDEVAAVEDVGEADGLVGAGEEGVEDGRETGELFGDVEALEAIDGPGEIGLAGVVGAGEDDEVLREVDLGVSEWAEVLDAEAHGDGE